MFAHQKGGLSNSKVLFLFLPFFFMHSLSLLIFFFNLCVLIEFLGLLWIGLVFFVFLQIPRDRSNLIRLLGVFQTLHAYGVCFLIPTIAGKKKLTPFFPFYLQLAFTLLWVSVFFPILIDNHVLGWWPLKLFLYLSWFTPLSRKLMKRF